VSPFGMALVPAQGGRDGTLYIADTDALLRVPWRAGEVRASAAPERVSALPAGPRNHHWTKNVIASADGRRLYVTVGSNSNIAENGIDAERGRALILEIDPATGAATEFARTASTSTSARSRRARTWSPPRFRPTMRWKRTSRRSAWPSPIAPAPPRCRRPSPTARSSACTAPGTAGRRPDSARPMTTP
jgi:hypothetical protein